MENWRFFCTVPQREKNVRLSVVFLLPLMLTNERTPASKPLIPSGAPTSPKKGGKCTLNCEWRRDSPFGASMHLGIPHSSIFEAQLPKRRFASRFAVRARQLEEKGSTLTDARGSSSSLIFYNFKSLAFPTLEDPDVLKSCAPTDCPKILVPFPP